MVIFRHGLLVCLAALPLSAGAIVDVSTAKSVRMNTTDALYFTVSDKNFVSAATAHHLSPDPTRVSFSFMSELLDMAGPFTAVLQSLDGSYSVTLTTSLTPTVSYLKSSSYTGTIWTLSGTFLLTAEQAAELFEGSGVVLVLRNEGSIVTVGQLPFTLAGDLSLCLAGSGISVGAVPSKVGWEDPPISESSASSVPEPWSGLLVFSAVAVFSAYRKVAHRPDGCRH